MADELADWMAGPLVALTAVQSVEKTAVETVEKWAAAMAVEMAVTTVARSVDDLGDRWVAGTVGWWAVE
jgi:hypothetical protein